MQEVKKKVFWSRGHIAKQTWNNRFDFLSLQLVGTRFQFNVKSFN